MPCYLVIDGKKQEMDEDIFDQMVEALNPNRDGKFNAMTSMIINITLLSIAMDELNDTNKPCLTQMRVIEN